MDGIDEPETRISGVVVGLIISIIESIRNDAVLDP